MSLTPKTRLVFAHANDDGTRSLPNESDAVSLQIAIRSSAARYVGHLAFRAAGGALEREFATERTVSAVSCDDTANALALIAALCIDPDARAAAPPEQEPTETKTKEPQKPAEVASSPVHLSHEASPRPLRSSFSLGPTIATGRAPSVLLGLRVGIEMAPEAPPATISIRPHFGFGLSAETSRLTESTGVEARFDVLLAYVHTCPLSFRLGTMLDLAPCVALRGGVVVAQGQGFDGPSSETNIWAEGLLGGRARLSKGALFAELALALAMHATRPTYYREGPLRTIYEVAWLGADAGASLGMYFP